MNTKKAFGIRLRQAREAAGLSLRKLQGALDDAVTYAQLAKYEKGVDCPSSKVLLALCATLSCTPDQLFRPIHVGVDGIAFRKKGRWTQLKEKAVNARVRESVDRYFELESLVGVPPRPFGPTGLSCKNEDDAERAAVRVRNEWGLGGNPIANLVELMEERQVKIQEVEADTGFDGCSGWGDVGCARFPVIVLGAWMNDDLARKRFTSAHELGHLVMDVGALEGRAAEAACHRFAGAFLLPKDDLFAQFGQHRMRVEWQELAVLKQEYGVSMAAVLHRIHDLGIISDAVYKRMSIERNTRGWRTQEPVKYVGLETCLRFRQLLYRALAEEKVSLSKAAELAGQSVEDLQSELAAEGGVKA